MSAPVDAVPERDERPRRPPRARRWILEAIVCVGLFLGVSAWQARNLVPTNSPAPAFELRALDDSRVSLESLRGKRVLLHFWTTWCGVCRREFSTLNALQQGLGPDEAVFAVVGDSDDPERVRAFVSEHHIEYPVLLGTAAVFRAFHVSAFPTNYFVNQDGMVRSHTIGMSSRWGLRARLSLSR